MSAFVCSPSHFQAIAAFASTRIRGDFRVDPRYVKGLDKVAEQYIENAITRGVNNLSSDELATIYANILYSENIRSVSARYPNDKFDDLPGLIDKPMHIMPTIRYSQYVSATMILKMLDCLQYQSCETSDYEKTLAYRLLCSIRRAAIRSLPGYDSAPWEFTGEITKAA